jgi:hemolysin III
LHFGEAYPAGVEIRTRPRFRGVTHEWAFFASIGVGAALVIGASGARAVVSATVFAASVALMFGASALYHRVWWTSAARRRLFAKVDHAGIYLLIAGTYTPFGLIVLDGAWRWTILAIVWTGALAAIVLKIAWGSTPKWVPATIGIGLGWVGVVAFPQLVEIGVAGVVLLLAGGLCYTAGAIVYARRRPDPVPHAFGYHELFHLLVIAAAACQYVAIAFFVLPRA